MSRFVREGRPSSGLVDLLKRYRLHELVIPTQSLNLNLLIDTVGSR